MNRDRLCLELAVSAFAISRSAADCIYNAKASNCASNPEKVRKNIVGKSLCEFAYSSSSIWASFGKELGLHILIDDTKQGITFFVKDEPPGDLQGAPLADIVQIQWKNNKVCEEWKAKDLLARRLNKKLKNIFFNGTDLYLYWRDDPYILAISPARETCVINKGVLYWYDTD